MSEFVKISNIKELNKFFNDRCNKDILFVEFCPEETIDKYSFAEEINGIKPVEYLVYPFNASMDDALVKVFDFIRSGHSVCFHVSLKKPEALRYCEQFMALLTLYHQGKKTVLHTETITGAIYPAKHKYVMPTPCVIGADSHGDYPLWSFCWEIDECRAYDWIKKLLEECRRKRPDADIYNLFDSIQPWLYDPPVGTTFQEKKKYYTQKIFKNLPREPEFLAPIYKKIESDESAISQFLSQHFELIINNLEDFLTFPGNWMFDKASDSFPPNVEIFEKSYYNYPLAFKITFGAGSITVIPEVMKEEFLKAIEKPAAGDGENGNPVSEVAVDVNDKIVVELITFPTKSSGKAFLKIDGKEMDITLLNLLRFLALYISSNEHEGLVWDDSHDNDNPGKNYVGGKSCGKLDMPWAQLFYMPSKNFGDRNELVSNIGAFLTTTLKTMAGDRYDSVLVREAGTNRGKFGDGFFEKIHNVKLVGFDKVIPIMKKQIEANGHKDYINKIIEEINT